MSSRTFLRALAGIVALGVLVRIAYLLTWGHDVQGYGDWNFFHWQANAIADGQGFLEPFRLRLGHELRPSAAHPPLYPLLLSGPSVLGLDSVMAHRAAGVLCGGATIALVGLVGRRAGGAALGARLGLAAAAVCALYPLMIAVDGALMSETLFGALIAAMLLAAYRFHERPGTARALVLGALIGLATLTRAEAILFLPFLVLPLAWRAASHRWRTGLLALAACLLVIAPWTIRNVAVFDDFVFVSTNDSTVVAGANCERTYYGDRIGGWVVQCLPPRTQDDEGAQGAVTRQQGMDYALDHVGRWPVVVGARFLRVWDLYDPAQELDFAEGRDRGTEIAGVAVYYLLLLLAIPGALLLRRRGVGWLILLSPIAVVVVAAIVGYGTPRLRHSFEPALCVLAAAGGLLIWDRLRGRARTSRPAAPAPAPDRPPATPGPAGPPPGPSPAA